MSDVSRTIQLIPQIFRYKLRLIAMRLILGFLITVIVAGCATPADEVAQRAIALTKAAPIYPLAAKRYGIEGIARVRICVLADGTVGKVEVAESSGSTELDAAAVDAAKRSKFQPAKTVSGKSVDSCVIAPYRFTLSPRPSYAQKIQDAIKPHIVPTEPVEGNPSVNIKVTTRPSGEIINAEVVESNGYPTWDRAVLTAVLKAGSIPLDVENKVPPVIYINFRAKP